MSSPLNISKVSEADIMCGAESSDSKSRYFNFVLHELAGKEQSNI